MFQYKQTKYSMTCQTFFGITDDILVIGYDNDGTDHDAMVCKVLQRCEEVNVKLNKEKCHLDAHPFFSSEK